MLTVAVSAVVLTAWLAGADPRSGPPFDPLQQLGMFYLDEPAPLLDGLGHTPGEPLLLVVCTGCEAPGVGGRVTVTDDPQVARAYGLLTDDGRAGPGYAVIDGDGRVRYRTFDPNLAANDRVMDVMLQGAR